MAGTRGRLQHREAVPAAPTNPSFAFGASMALHQAFTLADLLTVAADHHDLAWRFGAAVGEDLRDRYRTVA